MASRKRPEGKYLRQERKTIVGILLVLLIVCGAFFVGTKDLAKRDRQYKAKLEAMQEQLEEKQQYGEELDQEEIRVHTKEYVIEIAKSKLGLVYPGETVLRPRNDD